MLISRIAPTPSGFLHMGNVFSMVLTWAWMRRYGGKLILRIDDADEPRIRDEYIQDVFETLEFLGLDWDEGPRNLQEQKTVFSQKLRKNQYQSYLDYLNWKGLVYACECSRKVFQSHLDDGLYRFPCKHKNLLLHNPDFAWRITVDPEFSFTIKDEFGWEAEGKLIERMPDFVIRRRDGIPAYQLVSLVDDLTMGVNAIVRGMDLWDSSLAQIYLAQKLNRPEFLETRFIHHPLLLDAQSHKLSKSKGSGSIKDLREKGVNAEAIFNELGHYFGLGHLPIANANHVLDAFEAIKLQPR